MLALLVLHRAKLLASNQSVLALGVAPSGVRAAAPHSAPARTPGVYAKGLCKDAKPTKHIQPFTGERGLGFRQGCRDRTPKGFARTHTSGRTKSVQDAPTTNDHDCRDAKPTKRSYRDREFALFL